MIQRHLAIVNDKITLADKDCERMCFDVDVAKLEAENERLESGIHDVINYFRIYQDFGEWTKGLENIYQALKALESK